jgi:uracil-DNA glycosylase family 4
LQLSSESPTLSVELDPPPIAPESIDVRAEDPRVELAQFTRSVRAHLESLAATGAWGVPRAEPRPRAVVAAPSGVATPHAAGAAAQPEPQQRPPATPTVDAQTPLASAAVHRPDLVRLEILAKEAAVCTKCALHQTRHQSVFSRGTGASGLVFVGEGPGEEEDHQGLPFVGAAGQLLDRMILAMHLDRNDVYVCNIVKCRPPQNRKPDPEEMAQCTPFLTEQLASIRPQVIVALGAVAVQGLLGTTEGITRLRGQWKLYRGKVPVMPTFHPAYLLRQPQAKREVWKDLQEVLRQLESLRRNAGAADE